MKSITLIGAPVDDGGARRGCLMGPDALRTAKLAESLRELGHAVDDAGNLRLPDILARRDHDNTAIHHLSECAAWIALLQETADRIGDQKTIPLFMGGDHLMAAGTVSGMAQIAARAQRPQFVLWLDAHTDFHSLASTRSGNLHGTPVAYFTGQPGFDDGFPPLPRAIDPGNVFMMGIRSVDAAENAQIATAGINVIDMRAIDEEGIAKPLRDFLAKVRAAQGRLHVSLDVDFLQPTIAPAVGTTVPGGATFREAHLIMEMLHDSDLVTSLDIAELNPFLDDRGRTAKLMVDLVASLFGKRVMDRPTRSF